LLSCKFKRCDNFAETYRPCNKDLFIFYNKQRDKLKILYYDKNGFCLWYKRLEKAKFLLPPSKEGHCILTIEKLRWLLNGLDIKKLKGNQELLFDSYY